MPAQAGTQANPLRVAIIGSGPSGFYTADYLQKQPELVVAIDMFDRLPTPYGLVRGGVAPDHDKIKSVTKVYDRIAANPNFRFYGNVTLGEDITHADLLNHYHAIIYATGAQTDRHMEIPGENLSGSHAATEFVGWYNAHPDYRDLEFDLTQKRVAVIGNGNVAMDVVRILASTYGELSKTDIADYALDALQHSRVREIYVLGRRGPAQAAFTNPEIKELGEMAAAEVIVRPQDAELDPLSVEQLQIEHDRTAEVNVQILMRYADLDENGNGDSGVEHKPRQIHLRFLLSPVELIGTDHVEAIKIVKNELYKDDKGALRPRPTNEFETIPVGLVFRSIGYQGVPLEGVPFDERKAVIPNAQGRIFDPSGNHHVVGEYVVGWIKRGPSGVIGTNKPDAQETATMLLEDNTNSKLLNPAHPGRDAIESLLRERKPDFVTFNDWQLIDVVEQERGAALGRPRVKFSRIEDMLAALAERKASAASTPNVAAD
ncbi:MAG: FAD-dependent oxidoreductase [Burkholderiales bacterium]|nr:FAD-dependent oxidoreductase [Anaerolineae bacterium]